MVNKEKIAQKLQDLQLSITKGLEILDGKAYFSIDNWQRKEGGGGRSMVIAEGDVLEKGGVMFSAVHGKTPEKILKALKLSEADFFATGVSIVLHPINPMVPIIHMNVRYFEMSNGVWWFGGGIDLTPHYVNKAQAASFHKRLKAVCDRYSTEFYQGFKQWADDYFFIKHRNETRGVGGIFFDRLNTENTGLSQETLLEFILEVGYAFVPAWSEIVNENRSLPYGEVEKAWQGLRRGRYVEFNLVYDKGTKFGLDTDGRTESILVSMPPVANWHYNPIILEGSKEYDTLKMLKKDIPWLSFLAESKEAILN